MSSLIETLNKSVDKTPDQIVAALKGGNWVRGSDMTQEILDHWGRDRRLQLTRLRDDGWWKHGARTTYHVRLWTLRDIVGELEYYWFRPFEDMNDGIWPDTETERARRQHA